MAIPFAAYAVAGGLLQWGMQGRALNEQLDMLREQLAEEKAERERLRAPLLAMVGKESRVGAAAHRERMQQIGVSEAAAERRAKGYGRRAGHAPGARGMKWQARREFQRARTEESLGFAGREEQRQLRIASILAGLPAGGGATGRAIAAATGAKGRLGSEFIGDVAETWAWQQAGKQFQTKAAAKKPPVTVDPREWGMGRWGRRNWRARR